MAFVLKTNQKLESANIKVLTEGVEYVWTRQSVPQGFMGSEVVKPPTQGDRDTLILRKESRWILELDTKWRIEFGMLSMKEGGLRSPSEEKCRIFSGADKLNRHRLGWFSGLRLVQIYTVWWSSVRVGSSVPSRRLCYLCYLSVPQKLWLRAGSDI